MLSGSYSLTEINNLLNVTQSLLNCDEFQLLKLPHDAKVAAAFDERMRVKLGFGIQDVEQLAKSVTTTFDDLERDIHSFNRHHLLAYLFTHYMQKGAMINLDSMSMVSCWHILHAGLKELKPMQTVTPDAVEGLFLGFIGQLVKVDNLQAAQALHNYLLLGRKIALSTACSMGVPYTAKMIGAALLEGLKLDKRLVSDDLAQEFSCMAKVTEVLLQLPLFDQPFDAQLYSQWGLSKGAFYSIKAKLLGPLGDPSAVSLMTLYPKEILSMQTKLAVMLKSGYPKKSLQSKQVRFDEESSAMQEEVDSLTQELSTFRLIPSDTLLVRYDPKRSASASSSAAQEDPVDEFKKKKKSNSPLSASKK